MYTKLVTIFIIMLGFSTKMSFSQKGKDTILFINGDIIITKVTDTTMGLTSYVKPKRSRKIKTVDNDRIFSITDTNGTRIVYVYDTLIGNELTVEEMGYYILGQQDARKIVRGNLGLFPNFLLSAAAGATGSFLTPIVPFAVAGLFGLPRVKIKEDKVPNPECLLHDSYEMGYEREGKRKRKIRSLLGGGVGLILGLGTSVYLKAQGDEILK